MTKFPEDDGGITVTRLAGPGVSGLENDTPLHHFDVPAHRMPEFTRDPDSFVARLGLRPPRERPYGRVNLRVVPGEGGEVTAAAMSDDDSTLLRVDAPHACCYLSGEDEITCHMHHHDDPIA